MPNKPKVNWQIPSFPILLNATTIPPISIKVTISKVQNLSNDIKPKMEESIEASNPKHSIWNRDSQVSVEYLIPI